MFFGISFFSFSILSGTEKKEYLCQSISLFGILTFRERREAQLVLKFLEVSTHISPKIQGSIDYSRSQSEAFPLYKRFPLESLWFSSFRPNPDIPKTSKRC